MSIGIHISKVSHVLLNPHKNRKDMLSAIKKDCSKLKLGSCQIFVQGPRNSKMSNIDYTSIKLYCIETNIHLYVHSSYISVGILSVTKKNKNDAKSIYFIDIIVQQMKACDELDAKGFVLHLSKRTSKQIVESLTILYEYIYLFKTPILLEQPAKKADTNTTYETPEQINVLSELILTSIPALNWGWCIDTAHLYSAGIEVDVYNIMKKWFKSLKYPTYIKLFHLNGMGIDLFDTGKDSHEVIFGPDDDIWNCYLNMDDGFDISSIKKTSIWVICQFAKKNRIDLICEINRGKFKDVQFAIETLKYIMK